VERALGYERPPEGLGLVSSLWRVARAFVDEVERRESSAHRLPFDLADAFRKGIAAVKAGQPVLIDVVTQPR